MAKTVKKPSEGNISRGRSNPKSKVTSQGNSRNTRIKNKAAKRNNGNTPRVK